MRANALFGASVSVWLALHGVAQATTYSYTTIDFPGSIQTGASAINDSGQIVGVYNFGAGFLFSNGFYSTFTLQPDTQPTGINNSGQIVGSSSPGIFLDTNGSVTIIPLPVGATYAPGINNLGQVVGSFEDDAGIHTYVFSNGVLAIINALAGAMSFGINDAGDIVGNLNGGCFVYANGTLSTINPPGGTCIQVSGINDSGQIVGTFEDSNGDHGFIDSNNVFTTINVPGAFTTDADGINDLGQIVGQYSTVPGGAPLQGFLASPIPEPATMPLLGLGLGLLYALKGRTPRDR
jgi:probable HAF family extracellular repeat protein